MAGFGEVAAGISLTFQVFDGCIKGFVLLSEAQGLGSRADIFACQLEWEHYRLSKWASVVGLFDDKPQLRVANPDIVNRTLHTLEQLLTNTSSLQQNYGLELCPTEEEIREINAPKRLLGRLIERAGSNLVNETAKVYSRRNNAWKKLKWAAIDGDRFRIFLKDVRYFREQLESLLHPVDYASNALVFDETMRSIVSQGPDRTILEAMGEPLKSVDKAVAASARLRQAGLLLDLIAPSSSQRTGTWGPKSDGIAVRNPKPSPKVTRDMRKSMQQISDCKGHKHLEVYREVAVYDNSPVILEWKDVDCGMESKIKYRIASVASLLAEMEDKSFHCLRCVGYSKGPLNRYAYLFEPPADANLASMKSLEEVLNEARDRRQRIGLNKRLAIGLALAEAVLQLHTAGWLHKDIRPDNVLLFDNITEKDVQLVFLAGYQVARADNPLEATEDPLSREFSELYRHPAYLDQQRPEYHKGFDLYSLGCVLVELALWEYWPAILWRHSQDRQAQKPRSYKLDIQQLARNKSTLVEEKAMLLSQTSQTTNALMAEIEFHGGSAYKSIVSECLAGEYNQSWEDTDSLDDGLVVQERTVLVLRRLCVAAS